MVAGVKREKEAEKERKRSCVVAVVQRETGGENDRETDWGRERGRERAHESERERERADSVLHCAAVCRRVFQRVAEALLVFVSRLIGACCSALQCVVIVMCGEASHVHSVEQTCRTQSYHPAAPECPGPCDYHAQ